MLTIYNKLPTGGSNPPYIKKTENFTAETNNQYSVVMSDGVSKEVVIGSALENDFLVFDFSKWKRGLKGLTVKLLFQNEPLFNGEETFNSYLVDRPCVIYFRLFEGEWFIEDAVGLDGNYLDLENQLKELTEWPKTFTTENGTLTAYRDGRLEATQRLVFGTVTFTAVGGVGVMGYKDWFFPKTDTFKFVGLPIVHVEPSSTANTWQWGSHATPNLDVVSYTLMSTNVGPAFAAVELRAIGRWK